jgi:hypothetical protein
MGIRNELLLIENAIKKGWDVPERQIAEAKRLAQDVLADPDSTAREKQRAQSTMDAIEGSIRGNGC